MSRFSSDSRGLRSLETKEEVIAELGGILALSRLTGSEYGAVENWKRQPTFPSRHFLRMWLELLSRGCFASPELWGQAELPRNKAAVLSVLARKLRAAA